MQKKALGFGFSDAIVFSSFTSILVEMVTKLYHVVDALDDLRKLSCFKEFRDKVEIVVTCKRPKLAHSFTN